MNFRERQTFIVAATQQLKAGGRWTDFQDRLDTLEGVYRRERDVIAVKVMRSVEQAFGPAMLAAVERDPRTVVNPGMDPTVFQKIYDRQVKAFCNKVVNAMARQLGRGDDPDQVFAAHRHPLITKDHLRLAKRKNAKPVADYSISDDEGHMLIKFIVLMLKLALAYYTYFWIS